LNPRPFDHKSVAPPNHHLVRLKLVEDRLNQRRPGLNKKRPLTQKGTRNSGAPSCASDP